MDEKSLSLVKITGTGLIKDGAAEELKQKLESFKIEGFTKKQLWDLEEPKKEFIKTFLDLSWYLMEVAKEDLDKLTKEELTLLADLIAKKIKWRVICQKIACVPLTLTIFGMPIVFLLFVETSIWKYMRSYKKLKAFYGKDYFPFSEKYWGPSAKIESRSRAEIHKGNEPPPEEELPPDPGIL